MSGSKPGPGQPKGLTSDDLFGDLVDAPAPVEGEKRPERGPIRVRLGASDAEAPISPALAADLERLMATFDERRESTDNPGPPPAMAMPAVEPEAAPPPPPPPPPLRVITRTDVPTEPSLMLTPTPIDVEPLPDLPELKESEALSAEAEARSDLARLTSRLPRTAVEYPTHPLIRPVDLASVAEDAIESATPAAGGEPDVVLPHPPEPAAGLLYGPYRLVEKIAVGGMAEVFRALRSGVAGFEKVVAVKRILPHLSYNREFVEMFIDEAKMVAGLQHPNVVQIFDLGRIGGTYYIAMEYVDGGDLRTILKRLRERGLRMPLDLATLIASRLAAALDHAHKKKDAEGLPMRIVHRDVSPQNILISFDGEVKLTDFGIAKAATKASVTEKGALRGKLMYMSPEQAWGRAMDHRSDIYSLGIVLYEMLADQRPFQGSSEMSLLERVRQGSVTPPSELVPGIPGRLERLVMKAMQKEPEERYRDAGLLRQELEDLRSELGTADEKELGRFLRVLFGRKESGAVAPPAKPEPAPGLEVDFDGEGELPEALEESAVRLPKLSLERLLKRFA